ncbi:unnamed protein product [Zymoseptoria tritici ST99CH_3D7]|uniref:Leo1-like protein n=1 Tax=Zymoseptoria tritici (strain ST99CH_3D7) TaxID=1276538 RepID=A0A1X7RHW2_ZYMT9|nr:unnamed protein product [Zymoseptoria tritici ST99CH_3D7]
MADAEASSPPLSEAFPDEEATNGVNGHAEEEDDEDDVQPKSRRQKPGNGGDAQPELDDLFGDEEDEAEPATRQLDDEELDSGDDEGRADRAAQQEDTQQYETHEVLSMDLEVARQPVPEPSDGEMYLLKIPNFMSIEPQAWQTTAFQPPTADHHSKEASATFSAYNTAMSTVRWRHSPSNPAELQSNARINRWSDGSITLQLASDPTTQYEMDGNALAPPQVNPPKPTPFSVATNTKRGASKDAFTYLVVPVESAESLRITHKITASLNVKQSGTVEDDAIAQLQAALSQAANKTKVGGASGVLEATDVDPELQRKQAELAEKQAMRDRKKRENAQERDRMRSDRTLGRAGVYSGRSGGGLNVGMLEDDEMDGGRGRSQGNKARAKPRRRRNSEYSDDEDFGNKRFSKEDSYDQEDDFVAPSDEEEVVEDDDDEDDGIMEERAEKAPKRDRPRPAAAAETGDDEDAEGEEDDDLPQARTKRRRVVDDEDEDE